MYIFDFNDFYSKSSVKYKLNIVKIILRRSHGVFKDGCIDDGDFLGVLGGTNLIVGLAVVVVVIVVVGGDGGG